MIITLKEDCVFYYEIREIQCVDDLSLYCKKCKYRSKKTLEYGYENICEKDDRPERLNLRMFLNYVKRKYREGSFSKESLEMIFEEIERMDKDEGKNTVLDNYCLLFAFKEYTLEEYNMKNSTNYKSIEDVVYEEECVVGSTSQNLLLVKDTMYA